MTERHELRCKCGAVFALPDGKASDRVRCPKCRAVITLGDEAHEEQGAPKALVWGGVAAVSVAVLVAALLLWRGFSHERQRGKAGLALRVAQEAEAAGDWRQALSQYEMAMRLLPDNRRAQDGLERSRVEVNKIEVAERKQQSEGLLRRAQDAEQRRELQDACDSYKRALELDPESKDAQQGVTRTATALEAERQEAQRRLEEDRKQRDAEDKERVILAKVREERAATYPRYAEKSKVFYESLLRTETALQVGINYMGYMERVREMNFERKRWEDSLGGEEAIYPSALAMKTALACYVEAAGYWKLKTDSDYGSARYELQMQESWHRAGGIIQMARLCMDGQDAVSGLPCKVCEASGTEAFGKPCSFCNGAKVWPPRDVVRPN
jgi:tetratricopeptide (TPR) repeat protein/phage FluMu protein Com